MRLGVRQGGRVAADINDYLREVSERAGRSPSSPWRPELGGGSLA